jgi:hypothetical protein
MIFAKERGRVYVEEQASVASARDRSSSANSEALAMTSSPARCASLRGEDQQLAALRPTCDMALRSPRKLPDFICQETTQHFVGNSKQQKWKPTDVVSAEVTFERGRETYSNFVVNGRPLNIPAYARSGPALSQYLISHGQRGVWDLTQFGTNLMMIFREASEATFEPRGKTTVAGKPSIKFDFDVRIIHSPFQFFWSKSYSSPDGSSHGEDQVAPYGVQGSIWIEASTGDLLRIELNATDLPRNFSISSSRSATDYGLVSIGEAGQFLLPIASERVDCGKDEGRCYRDTLEFHGCRKFGSESHIVTK